LNNSHWRFFPFLYPFQKQKKTQSIKMQYSSAATILLGLLANLSQGSPILETRQMPSISQIADAQNQWAADTSKVSQFLSAAPNLSGQELTMQAAAALASEKDELTHKAVLDMAFLSTDLSVQQANAVLVTQSTFQVVVNGLNNLATNGASLSQGQVNTLVLQINTDRCNFVLPAIDTYFRASGEFLDTGLIAVANRPNNCPPSN
jgi:hypothetical protein